MTEYIKLSPRLEFYLLSSDLIKEHHEYAPKPDKNILKPITLKREWLNLPQLNSEVN